MPKYYIWTIGCQMNRAESDRLGSYLENAGYEPAAVQDDADLVILNSCVVRQSAENRVLNKLAVLRHLKKAKPNLAVSLTGCLVDSNISPLKKKFSHVDYFFKPGERPQWLDRSREWPIIPRVDSPCTFVTIMQGCDNFCSYCIVPYRRGREKSRPVQEIVGEVKALVGGGVKEVTLLGQNVDSYGHDLPGKPELADLLEELNSIDGLWRIRFLTNHPKDMSQRLIQTMAVLDKVCEQINLPVQSGDDDILKAMRRDYTVEHYRHLIADIRAVMSSVAITTDVIVGFPSESREQFRHTYDLLEKLRFDAVHVAAYSTRPGTIASREFEDDIPLEEKKERLRLIELLQEKIAGEINSRLVGSSVEVLVERRNKNKWEGRTGTGKLVFFSDKSHCVGQLVTVKIVDASAWSLQGIIDSIA